MKKTKTDRVKKNPKTKNKKNNMNKVKNINKNFFVWFGVCLAYIIFIGVLTWLYPFGGDELLAEDQKYLLPHIKNMVLHPYMALRVGCFVSTVFLHVGKIFYDILNPFFQLSVIFGAFYFIYMRFPRFNSLEDLPPFALLLVLGTFFIPSPSEMLLWIGGATNYVWAFVAFIGFLIYLRKLEEGKRIEKPILFLFILWGICLGMINENNSPMVLCLMFGFIVYAHYKKIVLRKDFWFLLLGAVIGVFILFKFSGNDVRLNYINFGVEHTNTLAEKLLMHIAHVHVFAAANLCLIYLLPLFLFLIFLDRRKEVLKDKNFYLSCICWIVAFGLAIVLCEAPRVATRAFYSSGWFCIFSVFFMMLEIEKLYKIKVIKYISFIFVLIFLYIAPLFALEVDSLAKNVTLRRTILDNAKKKGREIVYLWSSGGVDLLPDNLKITYYDGLGIKKKWSKIEGIEIKNEQGDSVRYI